MLSCLFIFWLFISLKEGVKMKFLAYCATVLASPSLGVVLLKLTLI